MASRTPDSADLHPGPGFRIRSLIERLGSDLAARLGRFDTPTISDALNRLYAVDADIRCLTEVDDLCAPACTVHVFPGDNLMVHKCLDVAQPGDVVIISAHGRAGSPINAVLGDIICTKARHRGIAGFIVDGYVRDLPGILELEMPVFARGTTAVGPLHRGPGEINYPIACGGVVTNPGDLVRADKAGIVVIPRSSAAQLADGLEQKEERAAAYLASVQRGDFSNEWVDGLLERGGCPVDDTPPQ